VAPILFFVAVVALRINTIIPQPGIWSIGLGFVAFGVPVFFIWRGVRRAADVPAVASPVDGSDR